MRLVRSLATCPRFPASVPNRVASGTVDKRASPATSQQARENKQVRVSLEGSGQVRLNSGTLVERVAGKLIHTFGATPADRSALRTWLPAGVCQALKPTAVVTALPRGQGRACAEAQRALALVRAAYSPAPMHRWPQHALSKGPPAGRGTQEPECAGHARQRQPRPFSKNR